jgi:hypothetical protein
VSAPAGEAAAAAAAGGGIAGSWEHTAAVAISSHIDVCWLLLGCICWHHMVL